MRLIILRMERLAVNTMILVLGRCEEISETRITTEGHSENSRSSGLVGNFAGIVANGIGDKSVVSVNRGVIFGRLASVRFLQYE